MTDSPVITSEAAVAESRANWCQEVLNTAPDRFHAGRQIARRRGALVEDGLVEFGFWTPELQDWRIADGDVFLEILRPQEELDLTATRTAGCSASSTRWPRRCPTVPSPRPRSTTCPPCRRGVRTRAISLK